MTNLEYQKRRELLIPQAEQHANETVAIMKIGDSQQRGYMWNKVFLAKMDELASNEGLLNWNPNRKVTNGLPRKTYKVSAVR